MDIVSDHKQISADEKRQIATQVKADLVDHLYQGCLPGTITGIVVSVALFIDFYGYTQTSYLIAWLTVFNLMMFALSILFFVYKKNLSQKMNLDRWELAYSVAMCGCALVWVPSILLMPVDTTRQYLALIALFLATTGYSTGTIGQFKLCVVCLNIILVPLTIWCFVKGGIFYNVVGVYSLIYMFFLMGINHRSTQWFKESLKLKIENTLVSYQANHDLLTNLPNQRLIPQFIESAIEFAVQSNQTFAVICFSLNRMEMINDSFGLQAGDSVTQSVAKRLTDLSTEMARLQDETRYVITISRKDTFNIIMIPIKADEIKSKVNSLFSILDEPFYLEQRGVKLTASIGVSVYDQDGKDSQTLLINADSAMLQAKQFGGNFVEFYRKEINEQMPKQVELETDLYRALKNNELVLYYQPLMDLKNHTLSGMEALIRWKHPTLGFISPGQFIPLAEETGFIIQIGEWVIYEACRQTKIWHDMGFKVKVAVNLAGKQLLQDNIVEIVKSALTETGFDSRYLELEITETAILNEKVIAIIKQFKEMGIALAVDDFGTGYSGLSYLKRIDVDKLKIDQSFIRDIPDNNDSITIVSAIIAMSKELNIKVLAEGVETLDQLNFLRAKGCEFIQGYYFSKPLDADKFTKLLLGDKEVSPNIFTELNQSMEESVK